MEQTIDLIWMMQNADYAHEVLKLARASNDAKTVRLADRFDQVLFGSAAAKPSAFQRVQSPAAVSASPAAEEGSGAGRYVGALR